MNKQARVTIRQFCDHFHVEFELVRSFAEFGLCPAVFSDDGVEIEIRDIYRLKRIIGLHEALGINKEGIDVILDLRERISALQEEVERLHGEVSTLRRRADAQSPEVLERIGLLIEVDD